jgi:orotidine-5'-phosphate decarboxylase
MIGRLKGDSGWSGLMLVTGATGPGEARKLRTLAPDALFLVPGYGAQGAGAAQAMAGFVPARNGGNRPEGGCVNASRSVTFPAGSETADSLESWHRIVEAAIDAAQADLNQVVLIS